MSARAKLRFFRVMAFAVGAGLLLLVAHMVLRYGFDNRLLAWWPAPHGWFYMVYLIAVALLGFELRWGMGKMVGVMWPGCSASLVLGGTGCTARRAQIARPRPARIGGRVPRNPVTAVTRSLVGDFGAQSARSTARAGGQVYSESCRTACRCEMWQRPGSDHPLGRPLVGLERTPGLDEASSPRACRLGICSGFRRCRGPGGDRRRTGSAITARPAPA